MDKPARLVVAAVETRPEQPEAPPFLVLDPVIVAERFSRAGRFRLPPFIGDPLRPVGPRHPVPALPPGETERRVVGQRARTLRPVAAARTAGSAAAAVIPSSPLSGDLETPSAGATAPGPSARGGDG